MNRNNINNKDTQGQGHTHLLVKGEAPLLIKRIIVEEVEIDQMRAVHGINKKTTVFTSIETNTITIDVKAQPVIVMSVEVVPTMMIEEIKDPPPIEGN